jgi:thiosulfate reductase cytochrome b subunit
MKVSLRSDTGGSRKGYTDDSRFDIIPAVANSVRHTLPVRVTHWITALCFLALLVSGIELVISHPRFYWGEDGHSLTPALFQIPIPASRPHVKTGYDYVLPDQNGWSRSLHFQTAWLAIFTGSLYAAYSLRTGHLRRGLLPKAADLSAAALSRSIASHLRFKPPGEEVWSYNVLQRLAYVFVIFGLFPLMIWTGLAMSPAITAAFPFLVDLVGGQQSARTLHFFATLALVVFFFVHVLMVWLAGFRSRVRAMITGRAEAQQEYL